VIKNSYRFDKKSENILAAERKIKNYNAQFHRDPTHLTETRSSRCISV